ncbi:MAG: hypothetical protein P8I94_02140 [Emcibacteraceae bacterium]|nr:hypothetical protein [Emcibacteraceae bacterium]
MKYTILKAQGLAEPYFCITETGLKILTLICALEEYYIVDSLEVDRHISLAEFMKTDRWLEFWERFDFEEYWIDTYENSMYTSDESVDALYGDEDLIDFYVLGKLTLTDCMLYDNFAYEEEKPHIMYEPEPSYAQYWIFSVIVVIIFIMFMLIAAGI